MSKDIESGSKFPADVNKLGHSRADYNRLGIHRDFPLHKEDGRSMGCVSPDTAFNLGISPENTVAIGFSLVPLASPEYDYLKNAPPSKADLAQYIKALAELEACPTKKGGMTDVDKLVPWEDLPSSFRRAFLTDKIMTSYRASEPRIEDACKLLEEGLKP